jgi:hypothetical protein
MHFSGRDVQLGGEAKEADRNLVAWTNIEISYSTCPATAISSESVRIGRAISRRIFFHSPFRCAFALGGIIGPKRAECKRLWAGFDALRAHFFGFTER